jgi:N-acylneuraminate cytidylyltransferase
VLAGTPLFQHAINTAQVAGAQACFISTDISQILNNDYGRNVHKLQRPVHLRGDTVEMAAVLIDLIEQSNISGTVVLLQATSPLRTSEHIQAAIKLFSTQKYELVMSVTTADRSVLKWGTLVNDNFKPVSEPKYCFSNRQLLPEVFKPNGAVYVFDAQWFVKNGGFVTDKIGALKMRLEDSHDIDTLDDFTLCEQIILSRQNYKATQQTDDIQTHNQS